MRPVRRNRLQFGRLRERLALRARGVVAGGVGPHRAARVVALERRERLRPLTALADWDACTDASACNVTYNGQSYSLALFGYYRALETNFITALEYYASPFYTRALFDWLLAYGVAAPDVPAALGGARPFAASYSGNVTLQAYSNSCGATMIVAGIAGQSCTDVAEYWLSGGDTPFNPPGFPTDTSLTAVGADALCAALADVGASTLISPQMTLWPAGYDTTQPTQFRLGDGGGEGTLSALVLASCETCSA